eukprot:364503-Chlamydomonas_euryale.AAC.7
MARAQLQRQRQGHVLASDQPADPRHIAGECCCVVLRPAERHFLQELRIGGQKFATQLPSAKSTKEGLDCTAFWTNALGCATVLHSPLCVSCTACTPSLPVCGWTLDRTVDASSRPSRERRCSRRTCTMCSRRASRSSSCCALLDSAKRRFCASRQQRWRRRQRRWRLRQPQHEWTASAVQVFSLEASQTNVIGAPSAVRGRP